jgi:hypothetical protein
MPSSSGVWEPVKGRASGGPAELVMVKVAAQTGGLVVRW